MKICQRTTCPSIDTATDTHLVKPQDMSTATPPGGQRTLQKRRQAQSVKEKQLKQTPTSTRQAGFGGSSNSILKLYTDEANGLRVDPLVVLFLAVGFIFSVVALHVVAKVTGKIF